MELVFKAPFCPPKFLNHSNQLNVPKPSTDSFPQTLTSSPTFFNHDDLPQQPFLFEQTNVTSIGDQPVYETHPTIQMDPLLHYCSTPSFFLISTPVPSWHCMYVNQLQSQITWHSPPPTLPFYLSFSQKMLHAVFCTLNEPCLFIAFASMAKCYSIETKAPTWLHLPFVPLHIQPLSKGLMIQPTQPSLYHPKEDPQFYKRLYYLEHPLEPFLPLTLGSFSNQTYELSLDNPPTLFVLESEESLVACFKDFVILRSSEKVAFYLLCPYPLSTETLNVPSSSSTSSSFPSSQHSPSYTNPSEKKIRLSPHSLSSFNSSPLSQQSHLASSLTSSLFSSTPLRTLSPRNTVTPSPKAPTSKHSLSTFPFSTKKQLQYLTSFPIPSSCQFHSIHCCSDIRTQQIQFAILYSNPSSSVSGLQLQFVTYDSILCQMHPLFILNEPVQQVLSIQWQLCPCLLIQTCDKSLHLWLGFLPLFPISVPKPFLELGWFDPSSSLIIVSTPSSSSSSSSSSELFYASLELPRWNSKPLHQLRNILTYAMPESDYWSFIFHPFPSTTSLSSLLLQSSPSEALLAVLSILYQEWKLNVLFASHSAQLAQVLTCLSSQLGWANYTDYFTLQFPELTTPFLFTSSLDHPNACVDPPHWLNYIHAKLGSDPHIAYPDLREIQSHFQISNTYTESLTTEHLLPRTTTVCDFLNRLVSFSHPCATSELLSLVQLLQRRIPFKSNFDSWPWCWQALFWGVIEQTKSCLLTTSLDPKLAAYLDRPELITNPSTTHETTRSTSTATTLTSVSSSSSSSSVKPSTTVPSSNLTETPLLDALQLFEFPTTPVHLEYVILSETNLEAMTLDWIKAEKLKAAEWYACKLFASCLGRAALHLHSQPFPSSSTSWTLPSMPSLSVTFPPTSHPQDTPTPITLDFPNHACDWPQFHFGIAMALSYQPSQACQETWLWLHRPKQCSPIFGGFLMGLGFTRQFKTLTPLLSIYLLRQSHIFVDMGYLLGLSIANRGSLDEILLRLVTLHPTDMGYSDPQATRLRQMTNLICLGLLRLGHSHFQLASIFLQQLQMCSDEPLAWCAAIGLAFMEGGQASPLLLPLFSQVLHSVSPCLVPTYIALGMVYFQSKKQEVLNLTLPPSSTAKSIKEMPPEVSFSRCVAYHLISWETIQPEVSFVNQFRVPGLPLYLDLPWVTATCYVMSIKFAGSSNETMLATLFYFLDWMLPFASSPALTYQEKIFKKSAKESMELLCLSCALVMAGTGDPRVYEKLYPLQQRLGPQVAYASHASIQLALGFLFCGQQKFSFITKTSAQVLGLLCATWPRYPSTYSDSLGPFQPLRHFWILAVQSKYYACQTLEGVPRSLTAQVLFTSNKEPKLYRLPCLISETEPLLSFKIQDPSVYPIQFDILPSSSSATMTSSSSSAVVFKLQPKSTSPFLTAFQRLCQHRPVRLSLPWLENVRSLAWMCGRFPWFKSWLGTSFSTLMDHLDATLLTMSPTLSLAESLQAWPTFSPNQRIQLACFWFWFEVSVVHQARVQLQLQEFQPSLELTNNEMKLLHKLMLFGMPEAT